MAGLTMMLLIFAAVLAVALLIQGVITLLAAWLITGERPGLGQVIKANVFSAIAYVVVFIVLFFQWAVLLQLGIPVPLLLLGSALLILVVPCWIFANCLNINLLQAFAILLLCGAVNIGLSMLSQPYLPAMQGLPGTHATTTLTQLPSHDASAHS